MELLRTSRNAPEDLRHQREIVSQRLPALRGKPIRLSLRPELAASRGKLLLPGRGRGTPVHAAAFLRERQIVLESALLSDGAQLRLILVHELFHFVWARLGNPARREYAALLANEHEKGVRGELGESSAVAKKQVHNPRSMRHWICESFCDTAAWQYAGVAEHSDFRLAAKWCQRRRECFNRIFRTVRAC